MASRARINRGDSRGRPVHENVLAVALWRLGAVEQEETGLAMSLCIGFSVNPLRRQRPKSRGSQYGGGGHARGLDLFRCVLMYRHQGMRQGPADHQGARFSSLMPLPAITVKRLVAENRA